jgi:hypothetical protein
MDTPPNNPVTETAGDLYKGAKGVGSDIANSRWVKDIQGFFKNPTAWGMGGAGLTAILAWFIGNAFGGGGVLGMALTAMLMPMFMMVGKNWGEGGLKEAFTGSRVVRRPDGSVVGQSSSRGPVLAPEIEAGAAGIDPDPGLAEAAAKYRSRGGRAIPPVEDGYRDTPPPRARYAGRDEDIAPLR